MEMFREYLREFPHHGYSNEHILNIFYDGVNWTVKNSLNAISNGDFMTKTQEEAYTLIENLAASSINQCEEYNRSRKVSSVYTKKFEEMSAKIDMLMQRDQKIVSSVEDSGEGAFQHVFSDKELEDQQAEVNYGGYQQKQQQNFYQPKNTSNAANSISAAQESKLELMMQQLMINQQKTASEINIKVDNINVKVDIMYQNLNNKWEFLSAYVKKLDTQVAQTVEAVKRPTGVLPGKNEQNPRNKFVNAITLRSGKELPHNERRTVETKEPIVVSAESETIDLEEDKCKEMVSELTVKLSFEDVVEMMPALKRYMKSLVTNKASPKESVMSISKRCSTLLQNRVPEKIEDPGIFVLSCEIEGAIFRRSLCDLGSSVNLMPYTMAKRLDFTNFKPTKIHLVFADRLVRHPVGVILDIDVVIGNYKIPVDFVVLELDQEPKDPLNLDCPFLSITGAIIDVKRGKIDLHLGDIIMKFEVDKMLKRPTLDGHNFSIDHASEDDKDEEMTEELLRDDPLEIALTIAESEHGYLNEDTTGFTNVLNFRVQMAHMIAFLSLDEGKLPTPKATADHLNPWSELKAPKVELKTLPAGLRYAFLGPNSTYPVIINAELNNVETAKLLCELKKFCRAIGYSLDDILGISSDLCMHMIYLEDESRNSIEHQRTLNLNLKDVVKKEIMKLLEAGIIYVISDSNWVIPVHIVPKKGRMLERLTNHSYYCFLDGYSGVFQIPIHPDDHEKTTFTCPYGTFAYRRMPFGLCDAPDTF
ncbi:hypothetical protein N665_0691s0008 [Sinapis alba]|nr:hypothetical protein N665_0691s0008 [Sinapis alba]